MWSIPTVGQTSAPALRRRLSATVSLYFRHRHKTHRVGAIINSNSSIHCPGHSTQVRSLSSLVQQQQQQLQLQLQQWKIQSFGESTSAFSARDWTWTTYSSKTKTSRLHFSSTATPTTKETAVICSVKKKKKVEILYASQTGTAQLFATMLAEAIHERISTTAATTNENETVALVHTAALSEKSVSDLFPRLWQSATTTAAAAAAASAGEKDDAYDHWYVFIVSTAGVGEAPDNARTFYKQLVQANAGSTTTARPADAAAADAIESATVVAPVKYCIFALGNSKAHSAHYCAFGKDLQTQLRQVQGATEIIPLALGDDGGDCLEDDFDQWQEVFLQRLEQEMKQGGQTDGSEATVAPTTTTANTSTTQEAPKNTTVTERHSNYPELRLKLPDLETRRLAVPASDLLKKAQNFYAEGTKQYPVVRNRVIRSDRPDAATNPAALRELQIATQGSHYRTGDHLLVYPRNSDLHVEAYLSVLKGRPDPHAVIQGPASTTTQATSNETVYPHPVGITIYETLRHCVDLQALPSPSLARWLTGKGRDELDYKRDVLVPQRTVLELLLESVEPVISLSDLLYQLPPLQPRYYSIASSNLAHPDTIYLTYRPVKYMTARGVIRRGVSTNYLSNIPDDSQQQQTLTAAIRSNPQFRLPSTAPGGKPPPILLLAGGCGVAPIRAFLDELCWNARQPNPVPYGPVHLFLGFRNPDDAVYTELVDEADSLGILAGQHITYTTGCVDCALVSDALISQGATVHQLLTNDEAVTYICGGARTFGVAIQNAVHEILRTEGGMSDAEATSHLQDLIKSNRFHEDLSD